MLEEILYYLQTVDPVYVYVILFVVAFIENVFPPIPGDIPVAFAGSLVAMLGLSPVLCVLWATVGSTLGFMVMYFLGKSTANFISRDANPKTKFGKMIVAFFTKENLTIASSNFRKYGYGLVLLNRFLPGSRSVISIVAGMSKLNFATIHISAAISAAAWNSLLIYGGITLGVAWQSITVNLSWYGVILTLILVSIFIFWFFIYKYKKKKGNEVHKIK